MMYRKLPPISVLRTFEAAARLQGFSAAAKELCITHSAVSQQIRALEERVGHALFYRSAHAMLLTEAGKRLSAEVRVALNGLEGIFNGGAAPLEEEQNVLTLEVMAPIATHWLIPRLQCFRQSNPGIFLDIKTTPDLVPLEDDAEVDLSLRYGDGNWRGVEKIKLSDETVFPVCSPAFRAAHPEITLENLKALPLLRHSLISWRHWFERAGLSKSGPDNGLAFNDVTHTMTAALMGQGIALARSLLVQEHLRHGRLVRLFDIDVVGTYSYYLTWHAQNAREPMMEVFRAWLIDQFEQVQPP
ncbi:MAG: gcvA [Paucimonas sp.]|jgi:LysR family glycine cleavage system transcriptional activator|nr:gcvA [Paucimonas sp.]